MKKSLTHAVKSPVVTEYAISVFNSESVLCDCSVRLGMFPHRHDDRFADAVLEWGCTHLLNPVFDLNR